MQKKNELDVLNDVGLAITDIVRHGRKMADDITRAAMINQYQAELIKELVAIIVEHNDEEQIRFARQMYRKFKNKLRCYYVKNKCA